MHFNIVHGSCGQATLYEGGEGNWRCGCCVLKYYTTNYGSSTWHGCLLLVSLHSLKLDNCLCFYNECWDEKYLCKIKLHRSGLRRDGMCQSRPDIYFIYSLYLIILLLTEWIQPHWKTLPHKKRKLIISGDLFLGDNEIIKKIRLSFFKNPLFFSLSILFHWLHKGIRIWLYCLEYFN